MEDYRLEQSGQEVQDILNGAAMQVDLTAENERAELAEQTLQGNIDAEALARENADGVLQGHIDDEETRAKAAIDDEALARENADIELQGHIDDEETRAKAAEKQNADDIDAIEEKIPTQASSSNQLADKDFVEDLVSTSSATFRGTFNLVSDLHLTVDASYTNIAAALGNAIAGADNNDFAFVMIPTSVDTPTEIASIERYKFNGTAWAFEFVLNNSGFTADQWAAINSGITSALVTKLGALPSAADLAAALLAKQDKLTFDQAPTPSSTNPVTSGGVYTAIDDEKGARVNADAALQQAIEAILLLIPSAATALNQLADKDFVNSSITTATATFRGTFNLVSDLQLTVDATHTDIAAALLNAISTADNNDYVFVQIPTSVDTPTEIRVTERYKFNGTSWQYEYDLNNSGFTAAQWEAINSGITTLLVTKLSNLPNATELAALFAGKQNTLTFDNAPVSGSDNPVKSGGLYDLFAAIDAKMPTGASDNNKLVAEDRLAAYVGGIIGALDATFDLTSADGHVTLRMTQTDGVIASLQILTSDIASASALATLGGQVSTNASDIAALQAAYAALTQSDVVVGALPSSGQQQNIIYRQPDQDHTPPQFYSDYMWNGSMWVLMATYNNAIDPRPKKASQNLVTSGGVFDNMGALDVSELNATENPHALAQYVDLSAALAAVPIDYQKGGMSIKFVQSSDNKYVQYRLTADEFTTDTTQWAISEEDVYVENPEFIHVEIDPKNRILWGIRSDGTVFFGAGVPPQVVDYVTSHLANIITSLAAKVDKVTGKSLVDDQYHEEIDNPEFIEVKTDSQNRILEGIKPNGTKHIEGDLEVKGNIINPGIQGQIDAAIEGMQEEVEQMLDTAQDTLSYFEPVENPEYSEVTIDSGNKILSERDNNGVLHENVGIETPSADIKQLNTNKLNLTEKGIYDFNNDIDKVYTTVEEAVAKKVDGIIRVGENVVIGLKTLDSPYSAADIEANYKNTLPAPKFPFVKQASIHRLYDDAATPNMLYICSHSDKHIFYSICPTDLKRAVYEEGYYTKYNANYFYYADKQTPSDIHKVVLPATVDGVSMNHRIKYIHEMSNGECLIEIENGDRIPGWEDGRHNNIYKVKKVFSGETIQESDVTLSIALDFYAEKISSFDNIVEYKAGHIVMAPYWGGRTGKVWITKDYGDTWDLIFCADPDNTHYIKPKAEHYGEQNAYGIYPTSELLNPEGQIDWSTPSNGNVHVHGIAYDRWYDRIWIVTGDGDWNTPHDVTGIWWTDDEGYTWKRIGGINDIKTQLIGIIPMDHCVLFPTDGFGDGFWRWSRNGKDEIIKIENCYNYLGYYDALKVVGQRSIKTKNDFYLCAFAPNQYNESYEDYPGGIVASPNGFDFEIIYKDEYFQGSDDTVEIGWGCDITDCGDKIILSAAQGGYLELKY